MGAEDPTISRGEASQPTSGAKEVASRLGLLQAGASFGHYRIEGLLGEGGMGVVYLARQERPAREVALKVIRPMRATQQSLRRFELEAEVLGRLQHPGIAQVYEAGTADAGAGAQPFFAMELVRGVPLTWFALEHRLGTRQRLELFAKICEAVQHAHTKGVIHRDLKPGNILVTEDGQPKILDFGVARLTDHDVQATTIHTDIGQLIGTVPYMSPEQVEGDPAELDTRSDVYALGVVLYELLTGRMPYDLSKKLIHEAARIIREDEPTRLSSIDRLLRGDVETIVAKAMEKEKDRRYQAASDLGSDISRYLRDEPIAARPASAGYQLRKFARRNRALVSGVVSAFTLLTAGLIGTTYGFVRANAARAEAERARVAERIQRTEAERQTAVANAVNVFLNEDLLGQASPDRQPDRDVTLRTVLDRASQRIEQIPQDVPEVEARLRLTLGEVYGRLDLRAQADPHLERARALTERVSGARSEPMAEALHASALWSSGDFRESGDFCRQALTIRIETLGQSHPLTLVTAGDLAMFEALGRGESAALFDRGIMSMVAMGRGKGESADQAEAAIKDILASVERSEASGRPADSALTIRRACEPFLKVPLLRQRIPVALAGAALVLDEKGYQGAALAAVREAAAFGQELLGPVHPDTLLALNNLAVQHQRRGEPEKAVTLLTDTLQSCERILPESHTSVLYTRNNLGTALTEVKRFEEAETCLRRSARDMAHHLGNEHPSTLVARGTLANLLRDMKRYAEAEAEYVSVRGIQMRTLAPGHIDIVTINSNLATLYLEEGRVADAEPLLRQATQDWLRLRGPTHDSTQATRRRHAAALRKTALFAEGESRLLENEAAGALTPKTHEDNRRALVLLYTEWNGAQPGKGYDAKAAEWRAKLEAIATPEKPAP